MSSKLCSTYVQVDLKVIKHNFNQLKKIVGKNSFQLPTRPNSKKSKQKSTNILAVIKADAYGHGAVTIAKQLDTLGVGCFGVSDIVEGIELRQKGINKPILVFESNMPEMISDIVKYDLTPTIYSFDMAAKLNAFAKRKKKCINVHIKIDTGMGRLGVWQGEAYEFVKKVHQLRHLVVLGLYTHFPSADTNKAFTKKQIQSLYKLVMKLDKSGLVIPYIHAANSMGVAGYPTNVLNLVRPGLMLYGLKPASNLLRSIKLKPALSVYSKVLYIKEIQRGRSVSYGRTFTAKKKMRVATIPIGYNDGYFRSLSNQGHVLIQDKKCMILGRVTMDQIVVDVSSVQNPKVGMKVTVLGKDGKRSISAEDIAQWAKTINYEIVCSLGNRLPRYYLK